METNKIYLGDCYELIKEIPDNSIIVIDPPFNINYHYDGFKDKENEETYLGKLENLIRDRQAVIIHYPEMLYKLSIKLGYAPTKVISWVYNSNTAKQHRDIAFYNIKPDMNAVKQPYKNPNDRRIKERIARGIIGGRLYDWWNINQIKNVSKKNINHPCIMPLEVMRNIIGILPNDKIIVDCFAGSGTTCVAAKELGRQYIGIEINEKYFNIAKDRLNGINQKGQTSLFDTDFEQMDLFGEKTDV